ncbi:poly-gamma-glutamate hydrolase family protein [Streptomyces sp. NPDC058872]|uniref:poly-gamma-glutamate hydrolase family protein n=1 Tax=Streptomyces sp. NPDC058872 TaxID=3346661 RepID=UPI0036888A19
MNSTSRRTLLTSVAAAAATLPLLNDLAGNGSTAAAAEAEEFASNAALYSSTDYEEGVNWMRRFRCGAPVTLNDYAKDPAATAPLSVLTSAPVRSTAIIAPHGGGLESGTTELCLTIAGYDRAEPGTEPTPDTSTPGAVQRDYWMFETLTASRPAPVKSLHVTSTHCDDPAALAVCSNNLYAVSLHGYKPDDAPMAKRILIGGRDQRLIRNLEWAFDQHGLNSSLGVEVVVAGANVELNGDDPTNIVNRTRTGAGAQLETSTELRRAMFGTFGSGSGRRGTAGVASSTAPDAPAYWNGFVNAVREAIDRHERGLDAPQ